MKKKSIFLGLMLFSSFALVSCGTKADDNKKEHYRGTETVADDHIPDIFSNSDIENSDIDNSESIYTVKHLLEDESGEYVLANTEVLRGKVGEKTIATAQTIDGYTPLEIDQKDITSDGKTVVDVKYKLNVYNVKVNTEANCGVISGGGNYNGLNNQTQLIAKPYIGYDFVGWFDENGKELSKDLTFDLDVDDNINVTGKFEVKDEFKDFAFTSNRTTCTVSGLINQTKSDVIIPEGVTDIEAKAFQNSSITSLELPETLENIGEEAFENSEKLGSVTIKSNALIGEDAFYGCISLSIINNQSDLSIGKGYSSKGYIAYYADVVITSGYDAIVNDCVFTLREDGLYLTSYIGNEKELVLPDSVTIGDETYNEYYIAKKSFTNKTCLESLTLSKALKGFESAYYDNEFAFHGCVNLRIVYNYSDISLDFYCGKITDYADAIYDISDSVRFMSNDLYDYVLMDIADTTIAEITRYKGDAKDLVINQIDNYETYIGGGVFKNNSNIESVTLGEGVTSINTNAFNNCVNLKSVNAPYVIDVCDGAFYKCINIKTVSIPKCENIESRAFFDNRSLISIDFSSVKSIDSYAFFNCVNLYQLVLPASLSYISDSNYYVDEYNTYAYTFGSCYKLREIINYSSLDIEAYSSNYGYIGYYAFNVVNDINDSYLNNENGFIVYDNPNDSNYNVPTLINYIGDDVDLTIPDNIKVIASDAFRETNIKTLVIPNTVIGMENGALLGANKLETLELASMFNMTLYNMFGEYYSYDLSKSYLPETLKTVVLDEGIEELNEEAFYKASSLKNIVIPKSIKNIAENVFSGCDFISVYYNGTTSDWVSDEITINDNPFVYATNIYTYNANGDVEFNGKNYIAETTFVVPDEMTIIPANRFNGFKFEKVILPEGVVEIEAAAFSNCNRLKEINFPSTLTTIGSTAFMNTKLTKLDIPSTVTEIGEGAFANCTSLVVLNIPSSIGVINDGLFSGCINLQKLTIGDVSSIGSSAFSGCRFLTSIDLPNTVTTIGAGAFANCIRLEEFNIPEDTTLSSIGTTAFCNDKKLKSISLKNTALTMIDSSTFEDCESLEVIEFNDLITYIAPDAIDGCTSLTFNEYNNGYYLGTISKPYNWLVSVKKGITEFEVPSMCKVIFNTAFNYNDSLERVIIPNTIDMDATNFNGMFYGCTSLEYLEVPKCYGNENKKYFASLFVRLSNNSSSGAANLNNYYVPESLEEVVINGSDAITASAFDGASYIKSITLSDSITIVGDNAFKNCLSLVTLDLGNGIKSVGQYFITGTKLTSITLPESVTTISQCAFAECGYLESVDLSKLDSPAFNTKVFYSSQALTTVKLPKNLESIPEYTFNMCLSLESIEIPESVTTIGQYAFWNCGIKSIDLSKCNLTTIGKYTFESCDALEEVKLPDNLTQLVDSMFYDCTSLSSINWPTSLTTIGVLSFHNTGFETLTIPETVTIIKRSAFNSCKKLKTIKVLGNISWAGNDERSYIFSQCTNLSSVTLNNNQQYIYPYMFQECESLKEINLPTSCFYIGHHAFYRSGLESIDLSNVNQIYAQAFEECTNLKTVKFNETTPSMTISEYAFRRSGLESVVIPDNFKTLGNSLFAECSKLKQVKIGSGLTSIPTSCFYGTSIITITIPSNITYIGGSAFQNCYKLKEVVNLSSLNITKGSTYNGYVGYYASNIYTSEGTSNIAYTDDGYVFLVNEGTAALIAYLGDESALVLPDSFELNDTTYNEYEIDEKAFVNSSNITSVVIPNSVTKIGDNAFENCPNLETVTIGNNVTYIGTYAFKSCTGLTSITFGNNVKTIDGYALQGCLSLVNVTLSDSIERIGSYCFSGCSNLTTITFGASFEAIGQCAFFECKKLDNLVFNDKLTELGTSAFNGCTGITTIDFNKVTTIGEKAFYGCTGLENLVLGSYITSIGKSSFENCTKLKTITFDDSLTSIGEKAFYNCSLIETLEFNTNLYSIGDYAFGRLYKLTTINFNTGLHEIGSDAFVNSGLEEITLPNIEVLGSDIFYASSSLKKITFADGLKVIPAGVCQSCSKLTDVVIPEGVEVIGNEAFRACSSLVKITLPDSLLSIGDNAFYYCSILKEIEIGDNSKLVTISKRAFMYTIIPSINLPNTVTKIGDEAFRACTYLKSFTIPENVTTFGTGIFSECSNLESVTINSKSTGIDMFNNCNKLATVVFGNNNESINENTFKNIQTLTTVTFSSNLKEIGNSAFYECKNLASITIPNTIESIGNYAFYGCTEITSIVIPKSITYLGDYSFSGCSKLNSFEFEEGINITKIPTGMLRYCTKITSIKIPNTVTSIGSSAYYGTSITMVTISKNITSIGSYAFYSCDELRKVVFEEGSQITTISDYAFSDCTKLNSINIPNQVTSIGICAFMNCKALDSITLPSALQTVGASAFNASGVMELEFGSNLKSIGQNAFQKCTFLSSVKFLENSNTVSISSYAFENCGVLTSVTLPSQITTISDYAFQNTGIKNIVIPASVEYISQYAFYNCGLLESVVFENGTESKMIQNYAFTNCSKLKSVTFPNTLYYIGTSAFENCTSLEEVDIPSSVTRLYNNTFKNCGVTKVTINCKYPAYDRYTFQDCTKLKEVYINNGNIGESCFSGCTSLEYVVMKNVSSSNVIGSYAFGGCDSFNKVFFESDTVIDVHLNMSSTTSQYVNATKYVYSETEPSEEGNYWHYVNGIPTIWE